MKFRTPRFEVNPRTYFQECITLLHPPRLAIVLMLIVMGAHLAPNVDYYRLTWQLIAIFFGVGFTAYRLDEFKDGTTSITIPRDHHLWTAIIGLSIAIVMAVIAIESTSRYLYIIFGLAVCGMVFYNLDIYPFKSKIYYAFVWGSMPIFGSYMLQTVELPPFRVITFSVVAAVIAISHLWLWGLRTCGRGKLCKKCTWTFDNVKEDRKCHSPVITCQDRLVMPKEINDHAKILINLDFIFVVFLTISIVLMHYGV